jgi:predicted nucleotide-binding protein
VVRGHIELPSDLHGLVYVPFDGDAWKIQLVKELKEAGFEIDANRAF